jgi:RHS repeat-associated protein
MEGLNYKSEATNPKQIPNLNDQNSKQDIYTTLNDHINEFYSWQMFDLDDNPKKGPSESLSFSGESQLSPANNSIMFKVFNDTYYIYSYDGKLLAEYERDGATEICTREYIYLGNRIVAEYQPGSNQYYYYMSDQINTTRLVTDETGNVVYSAAYGPYGDVQKLWMNTYDPKMKFSGKEREVFGNLDYFGARYYNNTQYRFLSVDPIINKEEALVNPQLWNLYSYCRNNPIAYYDPDGRFTLPIPIPLPMFFPPPLFPSPPDASNLRAKSLEKLYSKNNMTIVGRTLAGPIANLYIDLFNHFFSKKRSDRKHSQIKGKPDSVDRIDRDKSGGRGDRHAHGKNDKWSINEDGTSHDGNLGRVPKDAANWLRKKGFKIPKDRYPKKDN